MTRIPINTKRYAKKKMSYHGQHTPNISCAPYDYTYQLRNIRKEILRLTPQLMCLVNTIANEIAANTDAWTTVKVKKVGSLSVVQFYSLNRVKNVLVVGKFTEYNPAVRCPGNAFGFEVPQGKAFHFDGDLMSPARAATRVEYIKLATHLEQVVSAFNADNEAVYYSLLEAFENLRSLVGST